MLIYPKSIFLISVHTIFPPSDSEKGILRVWTVSKPTPIENIVLKDTGFHVLCTTRALNAACPSSDKQNQMIERSSERKGIMIPNVCVLSLFKDGGVGLYHLRRKQWIFNREHVSSWSCCLLFKEKVSDM